MGSKLEKIKRIKAIKVQKKIKIAIIIGIIVLTIIGVTIGTLYELDKSHKILGGNLEGIFSGKESTKGEEKQKKKAIEKAIDKFDELGEKVKKEELEVLRIQRKGELYYYISAKENSVEVNINTFEITRVNGILVDNL